MKFRITRAQLLGQLPDQSGPALIQWLDEMPAVFIFDGVPITEFQSRLWPRNREKLTAVESAMFKYLEKYGSITSATILSFCANPKSGIHSRFSNTANVHIKNLRSKLPGHLKLKTTRGSARDPGYWTLIKAER